MSAALHLLQYGSPGDSAAETEKELHLTDENEHLSPESRENSEETANYDASEVHLTASFTNDLHADEYLMSTEAPEESMTDRENKIPKEKIIDADGKAPEESITDAEGNQDGTGQAQSTPLSEDCEAKKRPSVLDLPQSQSPETDAREIDRSLVHTSIPTDSQSTSDEDASASFLPGNKNIPPEEGVDILSHEQPSPEEVASHNLVNTSKHQDGLSDDINSLDDEENIASDNPVEDTENIHNTSCINPGNYVNGEDTETKKRTSSLVIHLVSEAGKKKPVTESREGTNLQSDIANVVQRRKDNTFQSQEQSSQEDNQSEMESPESPRECMTFPGGSSPSFDAHLEAGGHKLLKHHFHKYRHDINTRESKDTKTENRISPQCVPPFSGNNEAMNDSIHTSENNSSRFDSDDEDASSDFHPWSADYPEKEDEIISQGSTSEDNEFDSQINSPKNKQVSFPKSSDATNPPRSISGGERATGINNDHIEKLSMNNEESEGENALQDTETTHRRQQRTLGHKMGYNPLPAEFAISSSWDLPWYKYLLGRVRREALRQACYNLLGNLTEPLENRMYNYIAWTKNSPPPSE